jgi:hypothetical protein
MTKGTLKETEFHPAAENAFEWLKEKLISDIPRAMRIKESFASAALSGNRLAEICLETLRRILEGEVVSDRYVLGLCWTLDRMGFLND